MVNTLIDVSLDAADVLMGPLAPWPLLNLAVWSAVLGVLLTLAFRYLSNQSALKRLADAASANLLAVRLFKHDPLTTLKCQARLLQCVALRLWHWLPALAVLSLPFAVVFGQFAVRYDYAPLAPGESVVVEMQIAPEAWEGLPEAAMEASDGLRVESPPLHDPERKAISWRIGAMAPEAAEIAWVLDLERIVAPIAVARDVKPIRVVGARYAASGFWDRLSHPTPRVLREDSVVRAILVHYPRRSTPILSMDIPWWITSLVISMLAAVAIRPLVKVNF